jgi:hypothetical protein
MTPKMFLGLTSKLNIFTFYDIQPKFQNKVYYLTAHEVHFIASLNISAVALL